ncbi:predicted protein [Sparassis crispa]|uniref:VASt domain-containing protein n=1 Tax=Sparassis crispa TaxID=139825 RepID=A0A401G569_9APHY|nr:predicted protein [Sparassis crispa]GBE77304.1 predicted protein [Sparassis crispa]
MPSNFFSKLVKNASSQYAPEHPRSPSPSPKRQLPSNGVNSASSTASTSRSRSYSESKPRQPSSEDESSDNPNVTVVPPSPRSASQGSDLTDEDATPRAEVPPTLGKHYGNGTIDSRKRRPSSLAQVTTNAPPSQTTTSAPTDEEGLATPTPASRTTFHEQPAPEHTISPVRSFGNLRKKSPSPNHPRSSTIATDQSRTPQSPLEVSHVPSAATQKSSSQGKSSRSKKSKAKDVQLPSRHERSASVPSTFSSSSLPQPPNISVMEDGTITSPTVSESPTEEMPSMRLLSSNTLPNFSSSLTVPDNADAVSIRSNSSTVTTSKKMRWRRRSTHSGNAPAPGQSPSANVSSTSLSPTKRKGTGSSLASALAVPGGLVMSSAGMSIPPISVDTPSSPGNSSLSSRKRRDSDFPRTPPSGRSRRTSLSYPTSELSDRDSFHSGEDIIGLSEDDDDDLDLDPDDIPVTGFAVASNKRNQDFHEQFPTIPEGDYLIEDYGCALQREILIQGRLYISENHMCFHANIFGWITDLCIPMYDVTALDKRMTAFVIPNAIQVTTHTAKYTFTSFLSRDTAFDVIFNVWRLARPETSSIGSLAQSPRGSLDGPSGVMEAGVATRNGNGLATPPGEVVSGKGLRGKVTRCACGRAGEHFNEVAMESVLPGTPEKIYNLMFTSGFIKDFMRDDQKLTDIQISDWMPTADNPKLLARVMSYIKPLNGSIGPRSTKCELRDETIHCDFDQYVAMMTTTRTPDVPSGGVFSVKTRTCITWASSISTKVLVTTQVEWTGRSFIKGIIEKNALDGQRMYHADLDKAMRDYIHAHQSEFIPEGVDAAAVEESTEAQAPEVPVLAERPQPSEEEVRKSREYERNQRGLQWAYETFEGTAKVARQSTEGALELLRDAWDQSSTTTILYFVIIFLAISNIWTLGMVGRKEEVGRRKEMKRTDEREKWVQGIVQALWEELIANRNTPGAAPWLRSTGDWKEEVAEINVVLDAIDQRVESIRESLKDLD